MILITDSSMLSPVLAYYLASHPHPRRTVTFKSTQNSNARDTPHHPLLLSRDSSRCSSDAAVSYYRRFTANCIGSKWSQAFQLRLTVIWGQGLFIVEVLGGGGGAGAQRILTRPSLPILNKVAHKRSLGSKIFNRPCG